MEYQNARRNPAATFQSPAEVVKAENLTRDQKLDILKQWEYDAREKEVAVEENMAGGDEDKLGLVLKAIDDLREGGIDTAESPHKQGGQ